GTSCSAPAPGMTDPGRRLVQPVELVSTRPGASSLADRRGRGNGRVESKCMVPVRQAFAEAVERLRSWAENIPVDHRNGEWECDFPDWGHLYAAWDQFLAAAL